MQNISYLVRSSQLRLCITEIYDDNGLIDMSILTIRYFTTTYGG